MKRREFITLVGDVAAALPLAARAQQPAMPAIGWLSAGSVSSQAPNMAALLQGLGETGYVEGRNVAVETRYADFRIDCLAALAAKAATTTIPIVFVNGGDPVGLGLVASFNRPAGNVAGVNFLGNALGSKRLGLLRELVPTASAIGFLADPTDPNTGAETKDMQDAAKAFGAKLIVAKASTASEVDSAVASLVEQRADALIVAAQAFFTSRSDQLIALTQRQALPAMYNQRALVAAGGPMSCGTSILDAFHQAGLYAGRILEGEKLADLPVMQSDKFEFVINLKTAEALGLTVPAGVLAIADEVIE